LLTLAAAAPAQQTIPLAGIAHVAIRVKSLDASRAFYQSLGYEEAFDLRRDNIPYESFIKINDQQFIELYPVDAANPEPGFLHLCFFSDDLNALHDDYASHGLTPNAVRKAGAGNLLFTMPGPLQPLGPGGKPVPENLEYTQYMPGSRHTEDIGKHLGAARGLEHGILSDEGRIADRLQGVSISAIDVTAAREFYTNDLNFKPLAGKPMILHLPGISGEFVSIVPASTLGAKASIVLETDAIGRAERHLKAHHIAIIKHSGQEALGITDPDGNLIVIESSK
jgi:catechol 2,3-dioxygenase-like lactoylglutathione lyase family enzyme